MEEHNELNQFLSEHLKHLDQYFGVWAMQEENFHAMLSLVRGVDLRNHVLNAGGNGASRLDKSGYMLMEGGVAVVEMVGTMTKYGSSMSALPFGTIGVRAQLRDAVKNDAVKAIVMLIDSPGGSSSGTADLGADIAKANLTKPVVAYIEDLGASAAYWAASQAGAVYANEGAIVGSIGTYMVINDLSAMYETDGVRTHVIRAGEFKGAGTPGTRISEGQLAEFQKTVNQINELFLEHVGAGRKMSAEQVKTLATGGVWMARDAKGLGLIDDVKTLDEVIGQLTAGTPVHKGSRVAPTKTKETKAMNDGNVEVIQAAPVLPKAATIGELEAGCPGASAEFIMTQLKGNATIQSAQSAFIAAQSAELAAAKAAAVEAEAKAKATVSSGHEPVGAGASKGAGSREGGSAKSEWDRLVNESVKSGHKHDRAVSLVDRQNPGLRQAMIEEVNASK